MNNTTVSSVARRLACRELQKLGARALNGPSAAHSVESARVWMLAAELSTPKSSAPLRERGFKCLREAIVTDAAKDRFAHSWSIEPGEFVEASAPVRVDIAGGWTDTPPQACERGGCVLNIALQLQGLPPLTARVERLTEPVLELVAEDLGERRLLTDNPDMLGKPDPRDPCGIHIAALTRLGIFSSIPLRERLRALGGGIRLITSADVPKGSGLGTSSILGAAVMAALLSAFGMDWTREELCTDVLCLEQLMGTGGGWQDQVGGVWGGAKLATSEPGVHQLPNVVSLELSAEVQTGLWERMLLFHTGEQRLAKNVLQRVVGNYFTGQQATISVLAEMPTLAHKASEALCSGDWATLGACLNRSRCLNQTLEPSSSNESLDNLFDLISPYVLGAKLSGAGGGGFLFALARDRQAHAEITEVLQRFPAPAMIYPCSLDDTGLQVLSG